MDSENESTCRNCGAAINRYCHSQAGSLKAYAWTDVPEDDEGDPRYGTFCQDHGDYPWVHVPEDGSDGSDA
jgi:hypothetical protein